MKRRRFVIGSLLAASLAIGVQADPPPRELTLTEAIRLAIQNNLSSKLARAATEQARGKALQDASGLLPQIMGTVQQSRVFKINLEAQGFPGNSPLFSPLLGPFNSFDARLQLVQSILDFHSIWKMEHGRAEKRAADLEERLAREQVAAAGALSYLEAQRTLRAVDAAQSQLKLSESLRKLARDQHGSGMATGVDVARAETNYALEDLRLIRAQLASREADIRLKRLIGLPMDTPLTLTVLSSTDSVDQPGVDQAIGEARHNRFELQIAHAFMESETYNLRSEKAGHLPSLIAKADYGFSGNTPDSTARTGSIGGLLQLPILSGGDTHGRVVEASAKEKEAQDRYDDMQAQVEEDVRLSLQILAAAIDEVRVSNQAVDLAQKELTMARDRYAAGVGDNIQLLSAQTSLDRALDGQVDTFAHFDTARVNLATALGHMQDFKP